MTQKIAEWARTPGGSRFCELLRTRLWRDGKLKKPLHLGDITDGEWNNIRDLFGRTACRQRGVVRLPLAEQVLRSGKLAIGLRRLLIEVGGSIITRRGHKRYALITKRLEVLAQRAALLAEIESVPELTTEHRPLAELAKEDKFVVPEGTATRTTNWMTYDSALRVAKLYYERTRIGMSIPERGLAATALQGSKVWTDASKLAFQNLIGKPFDEAVEVTDQPIQLRGPLTWRVDDVDVAKALPSQPWISIPLRALLFANAMDATPKGILLIENHTNFEQVCKHSEVHERWLIVWLEGFPSDKQAEFVRRFPGVPVAAWCDMDPPGIEIICKLEEKSRRPVTPIGMEPERWRRATKMREPATDREAFRHKAAKIKDRTPPTLRGLLACFLETGERVEQEELSVYDDVLAELPHILRELEQHNRSSEPT